MNKRIILNADEVVTCPDCGHAFALHEGITRQTIERYEQEFDAVLVDERKTLQASLEKDAVRKAEKEYQGQIETLCEQIEDGREATEKMKAKLDKARKKAAADARAVPSPKRASSGKSWRPRTRRWMTSVNRNSSCGVRSRRWRRRARSKSSNCSVNLTPKSRRSNKRQLRIIVYARQSCRKRYVMHRMPMRPSNAS